MILIKTVMIILALYAVFCLGPGITVYLLVFFRNNTVDYLQSDPVEHFFKGCEERYEERLAKLNALSHERIVIEGRDGKKLSADYYPKGQNKLAILMHGYRTDPYVNFAGLGCLLWELGYDLIIAYERGHYPSEGCTSLGILEQEDVIAWKEYAHEKYNPDAIIICGISMGAASSAYASDRLTGVDALILDCPYESPCVQLSDECKKRHIPPVMIMPTVRLCGRIHLKRDIGETVMSHLEKSEIPTLLIHGENDETVLIERAEKIYASIHSVKRFLRVKDAGHAASVIIGGSKAEKEITDFLKETIDGIF